MCGLVSPWNYPLNMSVWKFGPAIAAGNTVVLKPSDTTPVTTLMAASIIGEILPPGVFNVVAGDRDTGRLLVAHPTPALISVTGSERAGIEISGAAAADLKRVSLELGGKAPVLVFDDVDVAAAAAEIAQAGFLNAGQDCEAACRVLVAEPVYDEFVQHLVRAGARRLTYGPQDAEGAAFGALNSAAHLVKVEGFVDRLPGHARVLTGGHADRTGGGFFFPPTVVAGVRQDDEIVQEEVFGPVITVQPFLSEAEAVQLANDVRFGLAAGLWTRDHERVLRVSSAQLEFGKVWVNCHLVVAAEMPNSGYKHSGHGNDMSVLAIEEYTRVKHVSRAQLGPLLSCVSTISKEPDRTQRPDRRGCGRNRSHDRTYAESWPRWPPRSTPIRTASTRGGCAGSSTTCSTRACTAWSPAAPPVSSPR